MFRSAALAVLAIALSSSAAAAQGVWSEAKSLLDIGTRLVEQTTNSESDHAGFKVSYEVRVVGDEQQLGLYGWHGAVQTLDVMTTMSALSRPGNREANPLFKNGSASAMFAAKAMAVGANVYAAERLAKRNKKAAMWMMIASNAFMTTVVVNNALR